MKRQRAIELLNQCKPKLMARYGVTKLALFSSVVRNGVNLLIHTAQPTMDN